jgi:hypothetical protein
MNLIREHVRSLHPRPPKRAVEAISDNGGFSDDGFDVDSTVTGISEKPLAEGSMKPGAHKPFFEITEFPFLQCLESDGMWERVKCELDALLEGKHFEPW